ncbi:MAG: hypothetical protein EBU49_00275 [Proteobacteria bacterium]|nr:hypothetical protein [Pseudomonadota bacterium]
MISPKDLNFTNEELVLMKSRAYRLSSVDDFAWFLSRVLTWMEHTHPERFVVAYDPPDPNLEDLDGTV